MIEIRYANKDDYSLINTIDKTILPEKWETWTNEKQAMVTFLNGEFGGWLQYNYFMEKIPFVNRLYIFENMQGNSLGTGLMKFWEFEMVESGHRKLMLSTDENEGALDFYKKLGYKIMGNFEKFDGNKELLLGKEVTTADSCCCQCK